MFVARHHAKHVLNNGYLTSARIRHSVGKCDEIIKYSAPIFSFSSGTLRTSGFALGFQHFPRDLANVNEWKIIFDPSIERHYLISVIKSLG